MYTTTLKHNALSNRDNTFCYYEESLPVSLNQQSFSNQSSSLKPYYLNPLINDQCDDILDKLEQAGRVPSKDKFRRMACNTFICTGACPYNDRCVFMHDFRIKADGIKVRSTRQVRANTVIKDTFYWPDMTRNEICRHLDAHGLPDANQRYIIPETFASVYSSHHNRGIYSIWNHFVDFCMNNSRLQEYHQPIHTDPFFQASNGNQNKHIHGAYRLGIFVHLSTILEHQLNNYPKHCYDDFDLNTALNIQSPRSNYHRFDKSPFTSQEEMKNDTSSLTAYTSTHLLTQQTMNKSISRSLKTNTNSNTTQTLVLTPLRCEAIPFTPTTTSMPIMKSKNAGYDTTYLEKVCNLSPIYRNNNNYNNNNNTNNSHNNSSHFFSPDNTSFDWKHFKETCEVDSLVVVNGADDYDNALVLSITSTSDTDSLEDLVLAVDDLDHCLFDEFDILKETAAATVFDEDLGNSLEYMHDIDTDFEDDTDDLGVTLASIWKCPSSLMISTTTTSSGVATTTDGDGLVSDSGILPLQYNSYEDCEENRTDACISTTPDMFRNYFTTSNTTTNRNTRLLQRNDESICLMKGNNHIIAKEKNTNNDVIY